MGIFRRFRNPHSRNPYLSIKKKTQKNIWWWKFYRKFKGRVFNKMKKKNLIAKDLMSSKYKPRVIKPKKGKGSFKRKKK